MPEIEEVAKSLILQYPSLKDGETNHVSNLKTLIFLRGLQKHLIFEFKFSIKKNIDQNHNFQYIGKRAQNAVPPKKIDVV